MSLSKTTLTSTTKTLTPRNTDFPDSDDEFDLSPLLSTNHSSAAAPPPRPLSNTNKRTYNDILGDDDFNLNDYEPRIDKKLCWDEPDKILKAIRSMKADKTNTSKANDSTEYKSKRTGISVNIPSWNFIALTREHDAQRIYIRLKPESKNQHQEKQKKITGGLLSIDYQALKIEAEKLMIEQAKKASLEITQTLTPIISRTNSTKIDYQLWVDKYRPKAYIELLSEEQINCALLYWIKLWDKIVFNQDITVSKKRAETAMHHISGNKYKKLDNKEESELVDKKNFPIQRIALLTGPPGLGKTTLAHLVARRAGYNVVEINASNDRNPESFRQALLSSTQMKSLMGMGDAVARPNCLIFDEIDGAPTTSIDLLIQFVQGKLVAKGGKKKAMKENEFCKRPVICICNELYTPSLRALRSMAFVINVPKISSVTLANRLQTIARREHIKVDKSILKDLAEKSGCDIRSCLGALQYMGKDVTKDNVSLGTKDTKIGLFDAWREILQTPIQNNRRVSDFDRVQRILRIARDDNSERFAMGIFENYPQNCSDDFSMIVKAFEWFPFYDQITTLVRERQDWRVMAYANFAFVAWHMGFAMTKTPKLNFPFAAGEANQLLTRNKSILEVARKHSGEDSRALLLDVAPFMSELLTPKLRALAGHLLSPKEKAELQRLVDVMLDFGLTFVPDRDQEDGTLDFVLEPNLVALGSFSDCKARRVLPYAVKQIVIRELEHGRVNRRARAGNNRQELENNRQEKISQVEQSKDGQEVINDTRKTARPIHLKDMDKIIVPVLKKKVSIFLLLLFISR